jgi:hypothetical protein
MSLPEESNATAEARTTASCPPPTRARTRHIMLLGKGQYRAVAGRYYAGAPSQCQTGRPPRSVGSIAAPGRPSRPRPADRGGPRRSDDWHGQRLGKPLENAGLDDPLAGRPIALPSRSPAAASGRRHDVPALPYHGVSVAGGHAPCSRVVRSGRREGHHPTHQSPIFHSPAVAVGLPVKLWSLELTSQTSLRKYNGSSYVLRSEP